METPPSSPQYSKSLFGKPQIVIDHGKDTAKQLEEFIAAFNKRIDIEMYYCKSLKECAKMLDRHIDGTSEKSLSYISSAFKVDNEQRANQAKELADSLRTQVIEPAASLHRQYAELVKKSGKNLKKLNKDYQYYQDNYRRSEENYNENFLELKELFISKHLYKCTSEYSQEKKNKLVARNMESIKQKLEYEKLYRSSVGQFNQIMEIYRKDITEMLNQLENRERETIRLESDCMRKLIVCEVSMFKNVEYDLINITKQMEKINGENDVQEFCKQAQQIDSKEEAKTLVDKTVDADHSLLSVSLKNAEDQYYKWILALKKSKLLRLVMEERVKYLNLKQFHPEQQKIVKEPIVKQQEQNSSQVKEEEKEQNQSNPSQKQHKQLAENKENCEQKNIQQNHEPKASGNDSNTKHINKYWDMLEEDLFSPPKNVSIENQKQSRESTKQVFLEATFIINKIWKSDVPVNFEQFDKLRSILRRSHLFRIILYIFIEQYRIQHQVELRWANYGKASKMIGIFLDVCEKNNDVFVVKGLLGLLFTFFSFEGNNKKLLYQMNHVKSANIWKRQDFWQASIFESTYEQMVAFSSQKGQTQAQTLLREKNILFSQLASYCHYMLMLGSTSKNVRLTVGRYCRLYEMSDEQNKDLSKMITNTFKQIKEATMVNTSK